MFGHKQRKGNAKKILREFWNDPKQSQMIRKNPDDVHSIDLVPTEANIL